MKKRILAALVAVAMVFSICTIAGAADDLTLIFEENFEGSSCGISKVAGSATAEVFDDNGNKVWKLTGATKDFVTNYLVSDVQAADVYTVAFRVKGDCGIVCVGDYSEPWNIYVDGGSNTGWGNLNTEWKWYVLTVTGKTRYSMGGQVQGDLPVMGNTLYIDDVRVYAGNKVDEVKAEIEAAKPTPESTPLVDESGTAGTPAATTAPTAPTAAVTVTPSSTATAAPTVTPTSGTTAKKSIKFKKKKVTIKKGKKATLKVTIKGAKKAQFSVNKKGKKVVKLSKKKAKSVVVTGKKKGKATITAKAAGKKATCKVTVK